MTVLWTAMTVLRSVVVGGGSALPARCVTNEELSRPSTPPTNGSCSAPASGSATWRTPARPPRCSAPARRRRPSTMPASRRTTSTSSSAPPRRPTTPFRPPPREIQAGSRHARRLRLRRPGGLRRLRLRRDHRRQVPEHGQRPARPRHRRRDLLANPRLGGPHHLRAVRRRGRRHRAGGARRGGHDRRSRRAHREPALRRAPPGQALRRWRPRLHRHHRPPADGPARRCSASPSARSPT